MGFADELRANTKTQEQLDEEAEKRKNDELLSHLKTDVRDIKASCMDAAKQGRNHVRVNCDGSSSKDEARKLAEAINAVLLADGLQDVRYKIVGIKGRYHTWFYSIFDVSW